MIEMIKANLTGRGSVEDQLQEIRNYLMKDTQTESDKVYRMLEEIYRAITEQRPDYNAAAIKELWEKIRSVE